MDENHLVSDNNCNIVNILCSFFFKQGMINNVSVGSRLGWLTIGIEQDKCIW